MSASHLPERVEDWPSDPFAVLNVERSTDERTLKRAYTRLIRQYKPERAPQEFQLIRDAYESAQQQLAWGFYEDHISEVEQSAGNGETTSEGSQEGWKTPSPSLILADKLTTAWETAVSGDVAAADQQLAELQQSHPGDVDIVVRRYWLHRIHRSLGQNDAIEQLASVIVRQGLSGTAGELYLDELSRHPDESLSERCEAILSDPRSQPRLFELVRHRWAKAARGRQWSVITGDLEQLEPRFFDDTTSWLELHLQALEKSVWFDEDGARLVTERCRHAFEQHQEWGLTAAHLFDRYDTLMEQADDIAKLRESRAFSDLNRLLKLTTLIGSHPTGGDAVLRHELSSFFEHWLESPRGALTRLDAIARRSRVVLVRLLDLIESLPSRQYRYYHQLDGDELRQVLADDIDDRKHFGEFGPSTNYETLRMSVLSFCLNEFADVDDVARGLAELFPNLPAGTHSWFWHLSRDLPLRCVVRYWLVSWS